MIKVDKSFTDDIPHNARDCALVGAILELGERLGNGVIAEGVETAEQRAWLVAHGCRWLQGFLFSRPVAAETFLQLAQEAYQKRA